MGKSRGMRESKIEKGKEEEGGRGGKKKEKRWRPEKRKMKQKRG